MARILLGVTGGIAAYRALELARLATKAGHGVRVLMTPAATRFVGAASFEGIVGAPVLIEEWERDPLRGAFPGEPQPEHDPIGHLALVENADAYLVAPASANTVAKLAAGIADSMVTTSFLACTAPRLVAPAMNDRMYRDGATQRNLELLRERGVIVIEPDEGPLASRGEHGAGRLPQPRRAPAPGRGRAARPRGPVGRPAGAGHGRRHARADRFGPLHRQPLQRAHGRGAGRGRGAARGRRHAGRRERVPADRRRRRGGPRSRPRPSSPRRPARRSARAQVVLMAAAVADFRPAAAAEGKLAREGSGGLELRLEETEDVIAGLAAERRAEQTHRRASRPSTARTRSRGRGRSSSARDSTRSSSTTCRARRSASTRSATR